MCVKKRYFIIHTLHILIYFIQVQSTMAFAADLDRLTSILRSNAVENSVDPGMPLELLEVYASYEQEQRVDLVSLDLQRLLGREIHIEAHQVR